MKIAGVPEYDHICPDGLNGSTDLENCQVLCRKCHRRKSDNDVKMISKARRLREKAAGVRPKKRKMSYRKFDGTPVWR
jgi:5-methylcytosine-specific restriction endonuclease McrA